MELYVPNTKLNEITYTAPVKADAGRLFWYDDEQARIRIGWFSKMEGVYAHQINLQSNT